MIAAMLGGGRDPCLTIGDDSFTTTRFEDLGSLDNIDKGSSSEEVGKSQGRRHKGQETSGEDSGEGSLSQTSSERNSTGYVSSVPLSDTTDTGDTVIFCGESGISGMGVGGVGRSVSNDGSLSAGSTSDRGSNSGSPSGAPLQNDRIPQSRVTSAMCEDTYHDGGTLRGHVTTAPPPPSSPLHQEASVSGLLLPQCQRSTSDMSQDNIVTDSSFSDCGSTGTSPEVHPVMCNGTPRNNGTCDHEPLTATSQQQQQAVNRRRHPAESNGVLPHVVNSAVSRSAQGNSSPTATGLHTSYVAPRVGAVTNTSSLRVNSVDTGSAQIPQDSGKPANSSSREPSSRIRHYKV